MGFLPPVVQELRVSAVEAIAEWRKYGDATERTLTKAAAVAEAEATRMERVAAQAAITSEEVAAKASLGVKQVEERAALANAHAQAELERATAGAQAASARVIELQGQQATATAAYERALRDEAASFQAMAAAQVKADRAAMEGALAVTQAQERATQATGMASAASARATAEAKTAAAASTAAAEAAAAGALKSKGSFDHIKSAANTALMGTSVAMGVVGYESLKMAGDFQTATNLLVTGAGESRANVEKVGKGLLEMSSEVGIGAEELAKAMYLVESAGFHGQHGLDVMRAAAQGAKTDGADATEVANALTTVLTDMGSKAGPPAEMMSKMVAAVGQGKMRMNDLAGSIHSVLPNATALGISFAEVGGALATMTAQGVSADQAAQNLNHAIVSLANPTAVQIKAMAAYGLSALDVQQNLGKRGLTGTLDLLYEAVMKQSVGGVAMQDAFMKNKVAAEGLLTMYSKLPPEVQKLADSYTRGNITAKQYEETVKGLPQSSAVLAQQFKTASDRAAGFSQALRAGKGDLQTMSGALAQMTGGQVGLQVALHLTGENMEKFKEKVKAIDGTTAAADGSVKDFEETQKNFNQQLARSKAAVTALGIEIGTVLIPPISAALGWFQKHSTTTKVLAVSLLSLVGALAAVGAAMKVFAAYTAITKAVEAIKLFGVFAKVAAAAQKIWTAAQWAFNAAAAANPIGAVVAVVIALVAAVIYAYTHFKWFHDAVNAVGAFLKTAFIAAVHGAVAAWKWLTDGAAKAVDWFKSLPDRIWSALQALPGKLLSAVDTAIHAYLYMWGYGLGLVVKGAMELPGLVMNGLSALWGMITGLFTRVKEWLARTMLEMTIAAVRWGVETYRSVTDWFSQLPGRIMSFILSVHNTIVSTGVRIVTGARSWATEAVSSVTSWFARLPGQVMSFIGQLPGRIKGAFADAGSWLTNAGRSIVEGLVNGIKGMSGWAINQVKHFGSSLISGFKDSMGIRSPSAVFAEQGRWIPAGVAVGIAKDSHLAVAAVGRMGDAMSSVGLQANASIPVAPSGLSLGSTQAPGLPAMSRPSRGGVGDGDRELIQVTANLIVDGRTLYSNTQTQALRHADRNGTNGLQR